MILYHVSFDLSHNGIFIPRVPTTLMRKEDNSIPRICFSKTIDGCFTAIPSGRIAYDYPFLLFEINTDDLNKEDYLDTIQLLKYVPDAKYTDEVWITKQLTIRPTLNVIDDFEHYTSLALSMITKDELIDIVNEIITDYNLDCHYSYDYMKDSSIEKVFSSMQSDLDLLVGGDLMACVGDKNKDLQGWTYSHVHYHQLYPKEYNHYLNEDDLEKVDNNKSILIPDYVNETSFFT